MNLKLIHQIAQCNDFDTFAEIIEQEQEHNNQKTLADLYNIIEDVTGVSKELVQSKTRKRSVYYARVIMSYILRNEYNFTNENIGKELNRHHSAAAYYNKMYINRQYDSRLNNLFTKTLEKWQLMR